MNWKDFVKSAAVKTVSDADAARIDADARATGRPALRAPSKSEWIRFVTKDWGRDRLSDPQKELREQQQSPITDAVVNTGGRIRRGEYMDAFNGLLAGLTEIGQGRIAGGRQRGNVVPFRAKGYVRPAYDQSRRAAAGYLAERQGKPVSRKMLAGNLARTDPELIDSDVIIGIPRARLRKALDDSIPRYDSGKEAPLSMRWSTLRGLASDSLVDAAIRGYETWPSTVFSHVDHPAMVSYDKSLRARNAKRPESAKAEPVVVSYTRLADKIPSLIAEGDTFSPTSGTVASELKKGKTAKDIVMKWFSSPLSDINKYYSVDKSSPYGIWPKRYVDPSEKLTWDEAQNRIRDQLGFWGWRDNYLLAERKFLDNVPFNSDYIRGVFFPNDSFNKREKSYSEARNALNRLDIPFVTFKNRKLTDFGSDLPTADDYNAATTHDKRLMGILNGSLWSLRNK